MISNKDHLLNKDQNFHTLSKKNTVTVVLNLTFRMSVLYKDPYDLRKRLRKSVFMCGNRIYTCLNDILGQKPGVGNGLFLQLPIM